MADIRNLAVLSTAHTRSISPENFGGAKGGGGRATEGTGKNCAVDLGPGWKISPSVQIDGNATFELAAIDGPAVITHLWMTTHRNNWRSLILRAYWDGAEQPAIEVPVGDFFGQGWCTFAQLSSAVIAANPHGGFNSYWPMPFAGAARLTIENLSPEPAIVYYQLTYETNVDVPAGTGYLHAQFRRSNPLPDKTTHLILDTVEGAGKYVGTYMAWGVNRPGWWGEGELKMYLDGDTDYPTICGTGTEDYFGGAWNFDVPGNGYTTYSTPYLGLHQVLKPDGLYYSQQRFGMYRWHTADPVHFHTDLRVDIQALGWKSRGRYQPLQDDIASTALFYLDRPATRRPVLPDADDLAVFGAPMDPLT
ncbi:glycoside hydrolase family 172 protein [Catelliglobosispora koreensis]|uniref:glycoside hydrolase family 172 protein n=1 Tax=Catelliglobosispora koreensis TaxID=129052 RepID=UPI00036ECAB4|nr:glycoside hydrolase family 172 protein [Catelliglobosispora koreensis]